MLRQKPRLTYCGLTVVLSKPSRFDSNHLLSANGGCFFNEDCLMPNGVNIYQCDVRLMDDASPLLEGTKCVLCLGEDCHKKWIPETKDYTLNEIRGTPYDSIRLPGVIYIASYAPQEATDFRNYKANKSSDEDEEDDAPETDAKGRTNRTQRKNYRFWLAKDVKRAIRFIKEFNGKIPKRLYEPEYILYPPTQLIIEKLTNTKNQYLFFDMETDENNRIQCFSFSFGVGQPIYCVPVLDHNYKWFYGNLHHIFRALCIAIKGNILVAHNGSGYDFIYLGLHYHIPINKVEDTMLMQHRAYPLVEKSLGHCTSLWTYEKFHKDEGATGYNNQEQVKRKLSYCGKDVYTMVLIHTELWSHARRNPGLEDSFRQVNSSIRPYLLLTFTGIEYDNELVTKIKYDNDRLMEQYLRIINLLIGENTIKMYRRRYKSAIPTSNIQCVDYFHNLLGYPIVGWGKESKVDGKRKPSLSKKSIYKLRLKFDNPVIDFIIAYRQLAKETSSLKFTPFEWREHAGNNNVAQNNNP